jgi:hypothetical protein
MGEPGKDRSAEPQINLSQIVGKDHKYGYQFKAGQFEVKPFVVSLSNHERLNRPPFDKLRANG